MKHIFNLLCCIGRKLTGLKLGTKFPFLYKIYKKIYLLTNPKEIMKINVSGLKLFVDSSDMGIVPSLLNHGEHESYETKLLLSLLKPGMIIADIGANIGYYSLLITEYLKDDCKVFSFEPESRNYDLLRKNIKLNKFNNIFPVKKALSNKSGTVTLYTDITNKGNPSFSEKNVKIIDKSENVETITLDDFFENQQVDLDLIKIDTQGAEALIFEGAHNILKTNVIIIMEFWPYGLKNMNYDPLELLNKIESYGFYINVIGENRLKTIESSYKKIIEDCESRKSGRGFVNLLLKKTKKN